MIGLSCRIGSFRLVAVEIVAKREETTETASDGQITKTITETIIKIRYQQHWPSYNKALPSYNSIIRYLEKPELTPYLETLVTRSTCH